MFFEGRLYQVQFIGKDLSWQLACEFMARERFPLIKTPHSVQNVVPTTASVEDTRATLLKGIRAGY